MDTTLINDGFLKMYGLYIYIYIYIYKGPKMVIFLHNHTLCLNTKYFSDFAVDPSNTLIKLLWCIRERV